MKVIWANDKLQGIDLDKLRKGSNHGTDVRLSGYNQTKQKESTHTYVKIDLDQLMSRPPQPARSVSERSTCRVCGQEANLRSLNEAVDGLKPYNDLLYLSFGIQIQDAEFKICDQCAQMIQHVYRFKKVIAAAVQATRPPSEDSSSEAGTAEYDSIDDLTKPLQPPEGDSRRRNAVKRRKTLPPVEPKPKKAIIECSICRQKYPMITADRSTFVCSRCKISRVSDRTVACVKCRAVMPATAIKKHLEMHTTADLKGRCRLRSLPKKPSKVQTSESIPKKPKRPQKPQCKHCQKRFTKSQSLTEHMRMTHRDYSMPFKCTVCGKDMKCTEVLQKHYKSHENSALFECPVCGKIFKTRVAFQRHHLIHQRGTLT